MKKNILQLSIALCLLAIPAASTLAQVTLDPYRADVNDDGLIDVADISAITRVMSSGEIRITDMSPEGAEAIDMGLPSGTKWANMNVGASKPGDYGQFFAWGETIGYGNDKSDGRSFRWAEYKLLTQGKTSWKDINKYQIQDDRTSACWYDNAGSFSGDKNVALDPKDDAATANWGTKWRIPTYYELEELMEYSFWKWVEKDGVNGLELTSKINGNIIFLPAAGSRVDSSLDDQGEKGSYWASTIRPTDTLYGGCLIIASVGPYMYFNERSNGRSIRPVLKK